MIREGNSFYGFLLFIILEGQSNRIKHIVRSFKCIKNRNFVDE